jgi:hypothetical protein
MHATQQCLIRILARNALAPRSHIKSALAGHVPRAEEPTLVDLLLARKDRAGHDWPPNLRVEPKLDKSAWKGISPHMVRDLKKLTKEK